MISFSSLPRDYLFSSALSLLAAGICVAVFLMLPPSIPLWYSLARPQEHLTDRLSIFVIPASSIAVTLLHYLFIQRVSWLDPAIKRIASIATLFVSGLFVVVLIRLLVAVL